VLTPARQRSLRALVAILTLAALLSLPLQAFGAKGAGLTASVDTLSSKVTVNQLVAWRVTFNNSGKSAISGLQFTGSVAGPGQAVPADFYWATPPCDGADQFASCSFGTLPAGGNLNLVFVFEALVTSNLTFSGTFSAEAKNGTPGAKQDTWATGQSEPVDVRGTDEEFYGGWQVEGVDTTLGFAVNGASQKSALFVPAVDDQYWVAFGHINANVDCGSTTYTGYGLAVDLSVNNGDSPVSVIIDFAPQPGLNASTVQIVHKLDDGTCEFPPKVVGCATSGLTLCYEPFTIGSGPDRFVRVFVQLESNGRLKGW